MEGQESVLLQFYPWMKSEHFLECIGHLPKRDRLIIKMRFGILGISGEKCNKGDIGRKMPLKEIGKKLKISRERVRQLERRAISKLEWDIKRNEAFCL